MPRTFKIGSKVRCPKSGRRGEIVNFHSGGYTVRGLDGKYFVVESPVRYNDRTVKGARVMLQIKDVKKLVQAEYLGKGRYRCVDDPVWNGCIVDDREAQPVGRATP